MKLLLNIVGSLAVVLGILGIFLPLLPTVPFLLLASACFARSSERLHRALLHNKVLGPYLRDYEQGKGLPLKAKFYTTVLLWASLAFAALQVQGIGTRFALAAVGAGVTLYLWRFVPLKPVGSSAR